MTLPQKPKPTQTSRIKELYPVARSIMGDCLVQANVRNGSYPVIGLQPDSRPWAREQKADFAEVGSGW